MKRTILLLMLLITLILTGCWDRKDIESRGYILGVAIDKYPPFPQESEKNDPETASPKEEEKFERMELHTEEPLFAMTVQLPVLEETKKTSMGTGSSGGIQAARTWEITQVGNSFMSMNREILSRTNFAPYYEHLQVIIISEDVARGGIEQILDFFERDPEMRRRVKVFISVDQAKSILDVKPRIEDFSSMYLAKLPMNATKNSRMLYETDLGKFVNFIHTGLDFALPRVQATKDEIKVSGGAVFKSGKMVGWLSELELEAFNLIRDLYLGGVIVVKAPGGENGLVNLEVTKSKTKITPVIEGDQARFIIDIKTEGNYAEDLNMHTHGELNNTFMEKLEEEFAREIERVCKETIKKVQSEYGADIFHFGYLLSTEKPAYWKQVKEEWDLIFPDIETEINAEVDIILEGILK